VRDTGVGIPPSVLPHVFERFYRSRESGARSIEGTGIGLALVRDFARALGGDVSATSTPGEGSTFTVEIPFDGLSRPPASPRVERSGANGVSSAFVQEAESWVEKQSHAVPQQPLPVGPARRARILIVEDNGDMRQYLTHVLNRDYQVQAVADGAVALDAARASTPDLVLSDILMPGLDGLALVRALRANARTRSVPAILLTARAGEDAALEGLGSGADDYIIKPFSSRELRARIATHLELARMRREAAESAMKDTFIGIASHELRTPLMTLKLQLELLTRAARREPAECVPSGGPQFEAIRRGIARMEDVVDELLTVSAVKTGALALHREREDLVPICKNAADEQMLIAQRRVAVELPREPTFAFVDSQRVRQVVSSLLSNALKFSPPDRPVALRLRRADGEAVIAVRDEGPGIPPEALPHLFERFYRVPGTEVVSGSRAGLGLGLFISQAIVSRHGGRIEVETELGHGSTFSVRLPLDEGHAAQGAP
jgi:signal transduction histidine kinase